MEFEKKKSDEGLPSDNACASDESSLETAAASGNEALVKLFIQKGADINNANAFGWTPIMQAARYGHSSVVMKLLFNKADVTHVNKLGSSVLATAVASNDAATVSVVLNAILESESASTMDDPMPLALSALNGNLSVTQLLLEQGFNPCAAVPYSGLTPLMMAACDGHYSVADCLVNAGANPNALSAFHQTALDIASSRGHRDIQILLMKKMDIQIVTSCKSYVGHTDFPRMKSCDGNRLITEKIFKPSPEETFRILSQCTDHQVPQFLVNYDLGQRFSPLPFASTSSHCQKQNVFFSTPQVARRHLCQQKFGSESPFPVYGFLDEYCRFSPYLHHHKHTHSHTPSHSCMCGAETGGHLRKWNRRMSQSDPNLLKKDKKSITSWWKVTTGKLHSKIKSKKRAFVKFKIVKSLKYGSENNKNNIEDNIQEDDCGQMVCETAHPSCSSTFSVSPKSKNSDVEDYLHSNGLQEFVDIFMKHEVDLHTFYSLTVEDLEEMGIVSPREQIKILKSVLKRKRR